MFKKLSPILSSRVRRDPLHSPMIAAKHYLQTRDAHFDLAAGMAEAETNPATHARPGDPTGHQSRSTDFGAEAKEPRFNAEMAGCGGGCDSVGAEKTPAEAGGMTPRGFEPRFSG